MPVAAAATVPGDLPRHCRGGLSQPGCDDPERLAGMQPEADLLPVRQCHPARPWQPGIDPALRTARAALAMIRRSRAISDQPELPTAADRLAAVSCPQFPVDAFEVGFD